MLTWFQQRRRSIGRRLIAGFGLAWVLAALAPCVMAAPDCHTADMPPCRLAADGGEQHAMPGCDSLMQLDCQNLDDGVPATATVDAPAAQPVLLHTLPISLAPMPPRRAPYYSPADSLPRPPLIVLHRHLLI